MEKMRKNETPSPRKKKWKDRVLNLLMIGTVTLALGLTAAREKSAPAAQTGMTLPVEAVVLLLPPPQAVSMAVHIASARISADTFFIFSSSF